MSNSSSKRMTSSTVSSESAPRSSMKRAFGVTSGSSTPSSSTMICLTFSSTDMSAIGNLLIECTLLHGRVGTASRGRKRGFKFFGALGRNDGRAADDLLHESREHAARTELDPPLDAVRRERGDRLLPEHRRRNLSIE